jgi:glycosyltransferase involved in cell wall biosynthesis
LIVRELEGRDVEPRLSVVIPCLNAAEVLPVQLDALARQECSIAWEVVVADNGSTDESRAVAHAHADKLPSLRVSDTPRRGRHYACNDGVAAARGDLIVFVDADDEVAPGFLEAMAGALERCDIAAGRLAHGGEGEESQRYGQVQVEGLMDGYGFLPFAAGGCLGIRRSAFEAIGGFADDKPFCEDADFSWRAQLAGFRIEFVPTATVEVRQRASLRDMYRQHRNFGEGRVLLYRAYREHGMPRRTFVETAGEWLSIARSAAFLRTPDQKARWVRRLGRNVGFVRGALRHRVLYL